ncbi:hypothetical protein GYMLUDRAFT_43506 [Collybiopsis luxurians FD-317 M1]|uniref:Non-ribosomal peptide synthetase n=1 Tax=Collybiopsis luxurians FD-317 M1 TaxID=944289 RepID=A0A0D0CPW9_9AGAR|nr:hypothetical protein GYMLUDRAFT_43506 [Collybiopsis luxurians FD-317 M1]
MNQVSSQGPNDKEVNAVHMMSDGSSTSTESSNLERLVVVFPTDDSAPSDLPEDNASLSLDERAISWEDFENDVVSDKKHGRVVRNLRFKLLNVYRRLFSIVFITNMAIFIAFCVRGTSIPKLGQITIANLFVAILFRQEYVINALFTVLCSAPKSWPLWIRLKLCRVYSLPGGIHSGSGVSGVFWLILFSGQATRDFVEGGQISVPTLGITYSILLLLLVIVVTAYPAFRSKRHDSFEYTHRFMGWMAVGLVWGQVVLLNNDFREHLSLAHSLRINPTFWLVVILTAWVRLRKEPVHSEVLSSHVMRLYFEYDEPVPGSFFRISQDPLTEWHSFATIREPGKKGFSAIVSRAGDWTSEIIANPPSRIWVRGIPTSGVMRIVPLFRRVIIVATGSGIGPCAPHVFAKMTDIQLLWTAPSVRETFGDKLVDSIMEASPSAVIYDTRKNGKPDMVKLVARLVKEFKAEAVFIISNPPLTHKVVYGMMSRGVPAFGAIWDS